MGMRYFCSNVASAAAEVVVAPASTRLSKILSSSGITSRRQAEKWILDGRVAINGVTCKSPTCAVNEAKLNITLDGVRLAPKYNVEKPRIWAIHKMKEELVSSGEDGKARAQVVERFKKHLSKTDLELDMSFKPCYRLEYDTEGLCLITNNGGIAKILDSNFPRYFRVRVNGLLTESKLMGLKKGLLIDGM